jgi:MFS family permease
MGFVNTLDMPARQSFVIELVGKEDLTNGIALNSVQFNLARIIGPAIAALIMKPWGVASCFLINAVSYGAVILSLLFVKTLSVAQGTDEAGQNVIQYCRRPEIHFPQENAISTPAVFNSRGDIRDEYECPCTCLYR